MIYFFCWFWLGLIFGVSFIATPAKFLTTSSSLNQLLEVGKVTFGVFMYVEIVFIILLLVCVITCDRVLLLYKALLPSVVVILLTQYIFLLPKLDDRVDRMSNGLDVEPSNLHWLYVIAEVIKMVVLLILGIIAHQRTRALDVHIIKSPAIVK